MAKAPMTKGIAFMSYPYWFIIFISLIKWYRQILKDLHRHAKIQTALARILLIQPRVYCD